MKIKFEGKYKSLTDFETEDLEKFCVITGLNGSGKSQLLELLNFLQNKKEHSGVLDGHNYKVQILNDDFIPGVIKHIQYNGLNPTSLGSMNKQSYDNIKRNIVQNFKTLKRGQKIPNQHIAERIAKNAGKNTRQLTEEDVYDYELSHEDLGSTDIFQTNLGQIFYNYAYKKDLNEINTIRNEKYNKSYKVLTKEEFEKKYINPWELINKFLTKSKSDYQVEGVKEEEFNENITLAPKFIHNTSGDKIDVSALSSGERVIVSLAFCLFNIEIGEDNVFPKVLLLDEPDAPLHPTMTKEFLDVIYEELVLKKGITVILTTHSPSTVALTNEEFLYSMIKTGNRLVKTTKDKSLGILTSGINTISIEYENRRQIIVESNYDRKFYEMTYTKAKSSLHEDISLYFISSGIDKIPVSEEVPDGDCTRVKNIVKELSKGGNMKVFGLIDWDGKNKPNGNVLVNGYGIRYSLENYIFDPILLASILLDNQIISREDLNLSNNESFTDFESLSVSQLNFISNFVCNTVKAKLSEAPTDNSTISIEYLNGLTLQVQKWFLEHQGHILEKIIVKAFPKLKSEFGSKVKLPAIDSSLTDEEKEEKKKENKILFENQLVNIIKSKIVTKIIDSIPGFIPMDIIEILKTIQNN